MNNTISELAYWIAIKRATDEGFGALADSLVVMYWRDYPKKKQGA